MAAPSPVIAFAELNAVARSALLLRETATARPGSSGA